MARTVILNEASIKDLKHMLPKHVFQAVKAHETSLGENDAFPSLGDYPFDYLTLKTYYSNLCDKIEGAGFGQYILGDTEALLNDLGETVNQCKSLERPVRPQLEKICENHVKELFHVTDEAVNMHCTLVDKIQPEHPYRLLPEMELEDGSYSFKDTRDIQKARKSIEKRRLINALIQGISKTYSVLTPELKEEISQFGNDLPELYEKVILLNELLLFKKQEDLNDEDPKQGSYVEVTLGTNGKKSIIESQALIFPLLYRETIKGVFELLSGRGLPRNPEKAKYVIRRADFLMAEPWDMRFGTQLWHSIDPDFEDTQLLPFYFVNLIQKRTEEFNDDVKEMLSHTKRGEEVKQALAQQAQDDADYQGFEGTLQMKNADQSLINDSYFTASELDSLTLEDEPEEVLSEEESAKDVENLLIDAKWQDISFEQGEENQFVRNTFRLNVFVNDVKIPIDTLNLQVQVTRNKKYQLHIFLPEHLQGLGIGTKIYRAFLQATGQLYSGKMRMMNRPAITHIYDRLKNDPDVETWEDDISFNARLRNQD